MQSRPVIFFIRLSLFLAFFAFPSLCARADTFTIANGDVTGLCAAITTSNGNGVANTINLAAGGTYTLTSAYATGTDLTTGQGYSTGLPPVSGNNNLLTINGNRATISVSSAACGIFYLDANTDVAIQSVTFSGGSASYAGGAIWSSYYAGNLDLDLCTFNGNSAVNSGGAVEFDGNGTFLLTRSTLSGNFAGNVGGAVCLTDSAEIISCTFQGNTTDGLGGGIASDAQDVAVDLCTFYGNGSLAQGSGVDSDNGGSMIVAESTFIGGSGDQLYGNEGSFTVAGDDLFGSTSGGGDVVASGAAQFYSDGFNLADDAGDGLLTQPTDQLNTSPQVDPNGLVNNGGPTETVRLLAGSPAIDQGFDGLEFGMDQRGATRPYVNAGITEPPGGDGSDIGAYEVETPSITYLSPPSGLAGSTVVIHGVNVTNLASVTPVCTVDFNGSAATVTGSTATTVTVTVPAGVTTGPVHVTTIDGTATSPQTFVNAVTPTITGPADQTFLFPGTTGALPVTVGGPGGDTLSLSANSLNTTAVPNDPVNNLVIGGSAPNYTIDVTPAASGHARIVLTVTDETTGATNTTSFKVTGETYPAITPPSDQIVPVYYGSGPESLTISGDPGDELEVSGVSDNPAVVPSDASGIQIDNFASPPTLTIIPAAVGTANITLTVMDATTGLSTTAASFQVTALTALYGNSTTAIVGPTGSVNAAFVVDLQQAAGSDVSVDYTTQDGTAVAGTDYTATSGTLTIPAGSTSGTIDVPVLGTTADASGLNFSVVLSNAVNATILSGYGTPTCTIEHDTAPLASGTAPLPLTSGVGAAQVLTSDEDDVVGAGDIASEDLFVGDTSSPATSLHASYNVATNLLYLADGSGNLIGGYAPGSSNVITAPLGSLDCSQTVVYLDPYDVAVAWNLTPAAGLIGAQPVALSGTSVLGQTSGDQSQGTWTIGSPALINNTSVIAGTSTVNATFAVSMAAPSSLETSFSYTTQDGTAVSGTDYTSESGTLTIPAGSTSGTITVPVLGGEPTVTGGEFFVVLSNPVNTVLGTDIGTCTINYDVPPVASSVSPTPLTSSVGQSETLTATYSSADGTGALSAAAMCIGNLGTPATSLYVKYAPLNNLLYVANSSGTYIGGFAPGSNNVITTSLGSLNCAATTVSTAGGQLVVNWNITPAETMLGAQSDYLIASDVYGMNSGWQNLGAWTLTPAVPVAVSVSPSPLISAVGQAEQLTTVYSTLSGAGKLTGVALVAGPLNTPASALAVKYVPGTNLLYLADGSNVLNGGFTPGSAHTITTSQGSLNCALTTVTSSGNQLTVSWNLTPASPVLGTQPLNLIASDIYGQNSGWQDLGSWTIANSTALANSVTPSPLSSPNGQSEVLSTNYSDTNGTGTLSAVALSVGKLGSAATTLYAKYQVTTGFLYLANSSGTYVGGFAPGSSNVITGSEGTLDCSQTTVTVSGNNLTVAWALTPAAGLVGAQSDYLIASDVHGQSSGWQNLGSWTITRATPMAVSVTPSPLSSAYGVGQAITTTYSHGSGASALSGVGLCVGNLGTPANSLYAKYVPSTGLLYLANGSGTYIGGYQPGSANIISTGLGTLDCSQTTVTAVGDQLVIVWYITPSASLLGTQADYLIASDSYGQSSGWQNLGSWTITVPTLGYSGKGSTLGFATKKPSGGSS